MKRMSPWAYAYLVKAMEPGELTCRELAEITGLHILTIYHYCKALHQVGVVHVSALAPDRRGRQCIKIYKLGAGKDALPTKREQKRVRNIRQKEYRVRKKQIATLHALAGASA